MFPGGRKCKNQRNFNSDSEPTPPEAPSIHWSQLAKIDFLSVGKIFLSPGQKKIWVGGPIFFHSPVAVAATKASARFPAR
jgi:hypothetical protein